MRSAPRESGMFAWEEAVRAGYRLARANSQQVKATSHPMSRPRSQKQALLNRSHEFCQDAIRPVLQVQYMFPLGGFWRPPQDSGRDGDMCLGVLRQKPN